MAYGKLMGYNPYSVANAYKAAGGAYIANSLMGKPVYVGQGQKFGYGRVPTRTMTKTKRRKITGGGGTLTNAIRSMETAQHNSNCTQTAFGSNAQYFFNPVGSIVRGTSNTTRTNEEIFIEAIKINYSYATASSVKNGQKLRLILLWSDKEAGSGPNFAQNLLTESDLFIGTTASAVHLADGIIDPKKCTVVSDTTVCINSSFETMSERTCGAYTVPIKKAFVYKADGPYGKDRNLYFYACGDASGSESGAAIGTLTVSYDLIFKNSK